MEVKDWGRIGVPLLFAWQKSGCNGASDELVRKRRFEFPLEPVVFVNPICIIRTAPWFGCARNSWPESSQLHAGWLLQGCI